MPQPDGFTARLRARCKRPMDPEEQLLCWKAQGRWFAEERGVPTAPLIQGPTTLNRLRKPKEPRWVAKPNRGCTSRGIVVAEPNGPGYRNLMGQNVDGWRDTRTWEQWVSWMAWAMDQSQTVGAPFPDEWIIEGRIGSSPELPTEYGVYCIHGEPQFIRQVSLRGHRPGKHSRVWNWTPEGEPAGTVLISRRREGPLDPPPQRELLLHYARILATDWPGPLVRVDFLQGDQGPVFSELTPRPSGGRLTVTPEWDRRMGEAWERAERMEVTA